jgi:hypothetical protein
MYAIFVVFASHEHHDLQTKMFVDQDNEIAESKAKMWLFEETTHYLTNPPSKEELKQIFDSSTLDSVVSYMYEQDYDYGTLRIEIERYSHT